MIKKVKKILWKVDGMDYSDNPIVSESIFHLKYGNLLIGILKYKDNLWTFQYSQEFKEQNIMPIIDFPDTEKTYSTEQLWPFFATRIPSINQAFQIERIKKANISKDDSVGLLRLFGNETITNPFQLFAI